MIKKNSAVVFYLLLVQCAFAQTDSLKLKGRLSSLNDGVYFTFAELQKNKPSLAKEDLFKSAYDSSFSISSWSNTENLFFTRNGEHVKLNRDSLWGFVEKGTPFIYMRGRFHKMSTIGAICVFTESYPSVFTNSIVVTEVRGSSTQRIFDFEYGKVGDYDLDNVSSILARDAELFPEI